MRYDLYMVKAASQLFNLYRSVNPENFNNFVKKFKSYEKSGRHVSEETMKLLTMSEEERQRIAYEQARAEAEAQQAAQASGMASGEAILPKQEGFGESF